MIISVGGVDEIGAGIGGAVSLATSQTGTALLGSTQPLDGLRSTRICHLASVTGRSLDPTCSSSRLRVALYGLESRWRVASLVREVIPSFSKTFRKWY